MKAQKNLIRASVSSAIAPKDYGYWSGQTLGVLATVAGIGGGLVNYLHATVPNTEDEQTSRIALANLVVSIGTASSIGLIYLLNQTRTQQGKTNQEEYQAILKF